MYGESFSALEIVLAAFIMIVLPALIGLGIEIFDELERPRNKRK